MADFEKALDEVKPAFGASVETLEAYMGHGIISCGEAFDHLRETLGMLVQQVRQGLMEWWRGGDRRDGGGGARRAVGQWASCGARN